MSTDLHTIYDARRKGYEIKPVSSQYFHNAYKAEYTHYFRSRINFEPTDFGDGTAEFECHGLFNGVALIGLFAGFDTSFGTYVMHLSVVHPDYRRRGIYSAYLDWIVQHCRSRNLKRIISEHSNSNNAIIIAKLRKNFFITSLQVTPFYGCEVQLTHFLDAEMESIFKFRCGDLSLGPEHSERFAGQINAYREYFNKLV